jgi:hypothetical protein
VRKRENAGNSCASLEGHTNLNVVSKGSDQAAKPAKWLRWQALAAASHHKKPIKRLQQLLRRSFLVLQPFAFGTTNLPLHAIFMEVKKQFLRGWTQI